MAPQPPPARSRPPRIDRTKVSPSLLRVFVRTGGHHPDSDYTVDRLPSSEIALYCYPDSSLREVALLAQDALPPIPQPHRHAARISLRLVYYDPDTDRFRSTDLANFSLHDLASSSPPSTSSSAAHPARTTRLDRTLAEAKYVVGDLVDLALLVPQADPLAAPGAVPLGAGPAGPGAPFGIRGAAAGPRGGPHGAAPGGRGNFAPLAATGAGGPLGRGGPGGFGGAGGFGPGAGAGAGPGAGYGPRGAPGGAGGAPVHPSRAGLLGGGAGGPRRGGAPGAADQGWGAQGGRRRSDGPPGPGGFGAAAPALVVDRARTSSASAPLVPLSLAWRTPCVAAAAEESSPRR